MGKSPSRFTLDVLKQARNDDIRPISTRGRGHAVEARLIVKFVSPAYKSIRHGVNQDVYCTRQQRVDSFAHKGVALMDQPLELLQPRSGNSAPNLVNEYAGLDRT